MVALGAVGTASAADPTPGGALSSSPRPPENAACPASGTRGAIFETACDLSRGLGPLEGPILVVAAPPTGDRLVANPGELAARVAASVAAAAGATLPSPRAALTLGEARKLATGARVLVHVRIEVSGGRFRVTADGYPSALGFWDRVRGAVPGVQTHAAAERRIDGEVGSLLPPVSLGSSRPEKATAPADLVGLGCGDLDGDGSLDIVAVGRRRIEKGRIRAGKFEHVAEASWAALSPVAPSPLREPIASVVVSPGHVDVGLTDRRAGVRLDAVLAPVATFDPPVPWPGVGCLARAGVGLGAPRPCTAHDAPAMSVGAITDVDAIASTRVVSAAGRVRNVVAWRERATSTAVLLDDMGRSVRLPGVGGQIALGDLDVDGVPELVFGADVRNPTGDVLSVRSWTEDNQLRERARVAVADGIKALSVCPPDDARAAAVLVATALGIWVVR